MIFSHLCLQIIFQLGIYMYRTCKLATLVKSRRIAVSAVLPFRQCLSSAISGRLNIMSQGMITFMYRIFTVYGFFIMPYLAWPYACALGR